MSRTGFSIIDDVPADEFARIVEVCDGFERRSRAGESPKIEDLIAENPALPRPALLYELLTTEL